jgi:hypothetical protein
MRQWVAADQQPQVSDENENAMMPTEYKDLFIIRLAIRSLDIHLNRTAYYSAFRLKKACGFAQEFIVLQASSFRSIVSVLQIC